MLGDATSGNTWVQWYVPWDATSGEHRIQVRATNTAGETQTELSCRPGSRRRDRVALAHGQGPLSGDARFGPDHGRQCDQDPDEDDWSGAVLAWGAPRLRDLPWRATRDPWRILVAELMLQQTQVPRVIPKWQAFCDAFPTPAACAVGTAR